MFELFLCVSASVLPQSTQHSSELHADMKSFLSPFAAIPFQILKDNSDEIHCSNEPVTVIDVDITGKLSVA